MTKKFRAGIVQFDVKAGQIETNVKTLLGHLEGLAAENVSLAVLPEMFSCSFDNENLYTHSTYTDSIVERLSSFAEENQMAIAGTLPEREKERIYNTMVFIDRDGKVKAKYRKLHLFRLTGEHDYYTPGNAVVMADTSFGRVGLMICYDVRFPELARSLFLKGAHLILVSAQWPEPRQEHWKTLVRARAIENQLFMVCSNRTGQEDDLGFPGGSLIIDPLGEILADGGRTDRAMSAMIDPGQVERVRTQIPCMTDRRPEIYG